MDAIGLDDFRPWSADAADAAPTRPPSEEEAPLRRLLRDCCVAMGKQEADAQRFWTRLQAEWLDSPQQMRLLPKEAWQRLALPVGLEAELQRRLDCAVKDQKLKQLDLSAQRRRSPAVRKTAGPQGPRPRPATPATPATSVGSLRQVLRSHCGDAWAAQLLSQLRKERREAAVDGNALQSALRSLGVPSYSQAAVSHAVRHASRDTRGLPSAEEVVAAIHGNLSGARARMVDEVFFDLGGDIHGTLPRQMLKRRMATLELPAVKAGFSAEEALRSFTRHWGFQEVDRQSFSEAHVLLSALHRGEDDAFNHLLRRLWRLPKTTGEDVRDFPVPRLVSKKTEGLSAEQPDRAPVRANILEQERAPEDRSHRIANIEDAIQSSSRATELLERIRSALRSRGPDAVKLLTRRFQQEKGRGLGPKELRQALAEVGIGAQEEDVAQLLRGMDVDGSGTVDLEEWLRVLRGPLSPARAAVVREVFQSLRRADGLVDARTLRARFSASKHPDVEAGLKDAKEVYQEVMTQITSRSDRISLSDFAKYYEHLSAGIQDDKYFSHILRRSWGLATTPGNIMARNAHRMYEGHIRSTEGGLCGL